MTTDIVRVEPSGVAANLFGTAEPRVAIARITEYADLLKDVLEAQHLTTMIQGRRHVSVEGWTMLGSMLGVFPVCRWTRPVENAKGERIGWEARVEALTRAGEIVGAAESMCTTGERTWASRDSYALRSMAQTRATSKALRIPLGFIVVLAGYDALPEEELPTSTGPAERVPLTADIIAAQMEGRNAPIRHVEFREVPAQSPEQVERHYLSSFVTTEPDGWNRGDPPGSRATQAQVTLLHILAKQQGYERREDRLDGAFGTLIELGSEEYRAVRRSKGPLYSFTDLTMAEASTLIEAWEETSEAGPSPLAQTSGSPGTTAYPQETHTPASDSSSLLGDDGPATPEQVERAVELFGGGQTGRNRALKALRDSGNQAFTLEAASFGQLRDLIERKAGG